MRKWVGIGAIGILLVVFMSVAACTRSKLGPVPTVDATAPVTAVIQTATLTGPTVVSVDTVTPVGSTPTGEAQATPLPTITPTTFPGATPTPTTEPAATPTEVTGAEFEYVVTTGDTLWGLANRFGSTVNTIKSKNGLTSNMIYKGQKLTIPGTGTGDGETITHVVQRGENLFRISLKYGTTVQAIAATNNVINPSRIYAGQELVIVKGGQVPSGGTRYHVVQRGETLSGIALKYRTTPWKIAAANGISNVSFIYAGRTLRIP